MNMQDIEYQCNKYIHSQNESRRQQLRIAVICPHPPSASGLTPRMRSASLEAPKRETRPGNHRMAAGTTQGDPRALIHQRTLHHPTKLTAERHWRGGRKVVR